MADLRGDEWVHEFKWDGVRAIAVVTDDGLRLWSRNGNEVTAAYPELRDAPDLPAGMVLDGEVVALDADGAPSFSLLQHRMHVRDAARAQRVAAATPANLMLFDVIDDGGRSLVDMPLSQRREVLEGLVVGPRMAVPPQGDDPDVILAIAGQRGLEGLVSKRRDSRYQPGERSPDWRKVRLVREQDLVVVGWRRGRAGRSGSLGALLLASWEDDRLELAGSVGSGLKDVDLIWWQDHLTPVDEPPVVDATAGDDLVWCVPEHVVRVRFREWTPEGRLRQPTYRGRRTDVDLSATSREA